MSAVSTESPPAAKAPKGAAGMLVPVLGAAVLSSALAAGAVWFVTSRHAAAPAEAGAVAESMHGEGGGHGSGGHEGGAAPSGKKGTAQYLSLAPAFTVNLAEPDSSHFLQIDMEAMARESGTLDAVKQNMPQIRNALLLLFGQLKLADVSSREAKEALQKQVVTEISKVVTAETGKPGVDSVFFTSFVVQ